MKLSELPTDVFVKACDQILLQYGKGSLISKLNEDRELISCFLFSEAREKDMTYSQVHDLWSKCDKGEYSLFYQNYPQRSYNNYGDFPDIIQEMIKYEVEGQYNDYDKNTNYLNDDDHGGFDWSHTEKGHTFWNLTLQNKSLYKAYIYYYTEFLTGTIDNNSSSTQLTIQNDESRTSNSTSRRNTSKSLQDVFNSVREWQKGIDGRANQIRGSKKRVFA